jgi:hypothetical protein
MSYKVMKIENEVHLNGNVRAMLDTLADTCLEHALDAIQHPTPNRRSSQALVCFNAEEVLEGGADTEFYINDVAYDILVAAGVDVRVDREVLRLPSNHGIFFCSPYWH